MKAPFTGAFNQQPTPLDFLAARLPVADLTAAAIAGEVPEAVVDEPPTSHNCSSQQSIFDRLTRALYRRSNRHVILTGLKGVGKTTVVRDLVRRAAQGEISFLADRRFLWIDAKNVGPEDSRGCLETILAITAARNNQRSTAPKNQRLKLGENLAGSRPSILPIYKRLLFQQFSADAADITADGDSRVGGRFAALANYQRLIFR